MTDEQIESAFQKCGGKWDGDRWVIEDADLHPFARTLLATPDAAEAGKDARDAKPLNEHWTIRRVDKDRFFVEAAGMASATVSVMSFDPLEMLLAHMAEELLAALPPSGAPAAPLGGEKEREE